METQDVLIAEYNSLREEIQSNSRLTAQIFTVAMTASASLIGYGLQASNWIVFLSPFAILLPSLYFISSQLETTTRIAAYIQTTIEPKLNGLNWETEWLRIRERNLLPAKRTYTFSISGLYGAVGFVCLFLSWLFVEPASTRTVTILGVVSLLMIAVMAHAISTIRRAFTLDFCLEHVNSWRELHQQKEG